MADPTHVGGFTYASSTSEATTVAPTLPAGIQAGDVGVMMYVFHPTTGTPAVPTGWTQLDTEAMGSAMASLCVRQMDGTEGGTSVQLSAAAQKFAYNVEVYRGAVLPGAGDWAVIAATATSATHPAPTLTAPAAGAATLSLYQRRASGEITSVTQPSGLTMIRAYADGSGGGNTTAAAAHLLTTSAGGATIGGGSWAITPNEWGVVYTVALEPVATAPVTLTFNAVTTAATATGGTAQAVLADSDDATYLTLTNSQTADLSLRRIEAPAGDFTVSLRAARFDSSSGSLSCVLYDGATARTAPVTATPGTSAGDLTVTFPSADLGDVTADRWQSGALFVRVTATVAA